MISAPVYCRTFIGRRAQIDALQQRFDAQSAQNSVLLRAQRDSEWAAIELEQAVADLSGVPVARSSAVVTESGLPPPSPSSPRCGSSEQRLR